MAPAVIYLALGLLLATYVVAEMRTAPRVAASLACSALLVSLLSFILAVI